ncbi:MAG: 50S ribosomal protein L24 [Parcubacteria group bacterium GW2011_GWF2_39_13b]|nr:MAG: 50S ribosomal protein L24 [Parcubacteria group bacterium GW2011_GWF2_39_13b]
MVFAADSHRYMKIKKNDTILIISGKDKGKKGKVLKVMPKESKIVVEGLNLIKKHQRPRKQGEKGQVIEIARPFNISNVKLVCPKCGQGTRVGYKIAEKEKFRMCKKCDSEI